MQINRIDHLVLTVADIQRICEFYTKVLGMELEKFADGRLALKFGNQKLNLHQLNQEFKPHALKPTPGSVDLCLIVNNSIADTISHLQTYQVEIIEGPASRTGAMGKITSIYIRDPDRNLIELSKYEI